MKYLAYLLLSALLFWSASSHAEGGCPPGQYPQQGQGWQSCVPISGYDQGQGQTQARPGQWLSRWLAFAADSNKGILGVSLDRGSKEDAENLAIADCKAKGGDECLIDANYSNGCVAMFVGDTIRGTQGGATQAEAESAAMEHCNTRTSSCRIYFSACSFPILI